MSSGKGLLPIAVVGKGKTLCTTSTQDQYFVVDTSGRASKVDLLKACRLYQEATKLVWGARSVSVQVEPERAASKPRSTEKWRRKMQEALQDMESNTSSKT